MELMQMILNSKKVKYVVLEKLVKYLPQDTDELNIFINADSIFRSFYNPTVKEQLNAISSNDKYLLSSEFINIIAHYRHFFYSRYSMPTNFFVYYSDQEAKYPKELSSAYKVDYYTKRDMNSYEFGNLNRAINKNMHLSSILSEYLPNIYIINTKTLEPSVLPYSIISKNGELKGLTNLIITNSKIDFQLVNLPSTYVLDLRGDDSVIISKDNLMERLLTKSRAKNSTSLDSAFYTSILAVSGIKELNIDGIPGCGPIKTINKIEKAISTKLMTNDEISAKFNITAGSVFKEHETLIKRNYNMINLENLYKNISPKEKYNIIESLKNKSDNMSLIEINQKYYEDYPLMLIELMEGE